jgi:hypothetical protein
VELLIVTDVVMQLHNRLSVEASCTQSSLRKTLGFNRGTVEVAIVTRTFSGSIRFCKPRITCAAPELIPNVRKRLVYLEGLRAKKSKTEKQAREGVEEASRDSLNSETVSLIPIVS